MASQSTADRPTRTDARTGGDAWAYVMVAIVILTALVLMLQLARYT